MIGRSAARAAAAFAWLENALIALFAGLLILLAGGQIVARIAFDAGWADIENVLRALVLWIALLGAMIAAREDRHLAIDALSRYLRGNGARVARVFAYGAAAVIAALVAWHALQLVRGEFAAGTEAFSNVPAWAVQSIMPLAFAVMAVRFAVHAFLPPRVEVAAAAGAMPGHTAA